MAVPYGTRHMMSSEDVFPQHLLMVGPISPDMEYMSNEDKGRGRQPKQKKDERTGLLQWKGVFSDPSAGKERDASVTVVFLAEVQPVPPADVEVMPGVRVRPVVLEGVTVEPRVMGDKFKYLGYTVRASAMRAPSAGTGSKPVGRASAGKADGDAVSKSAAA